MTSDRRGPKCAFKDWVNDWRSCVKVLEEDAGQRRASAATERPLSITAAWEGEDHDVMQVLLFDPSVDEGRKMARITSRDFDNKVALYSHRTRDTGLARAITNKGRPRYLVEQGRDALKWAAVAEGMPITHLITATREGAIGLGQLQRIMRSKRPQAEMKELAQKIRQRIFEAEQEIIAMQAELRVIDREIERLEK